MSSRDQAVSLFRQLYRAAGRLPTVRPLTPTPPGTPPSSEAKVKRSVLYIISRLRVTMTSEASHAVFSCRY